MSNQLIKLFEEASQKEKEANAKPISFISNSMRYNENAVRLNDSFYEIVGGKLNGNLVHVWDVQ